MSILPSQTNINYLDTWSLLNTSNVSFASSIRIDNGTINTSQIDLDAVRMDCAVINGNPTLLLNGNPVAGVSSLTSSVTAWANYPSLTTINYTPGFGGNINMSNVNALANVSTGNLLTAKSITVPTGGVVSMLGFTFPTAPSNSTNQITSMTQSVTGIANGSTYTLDFAGQSGGYYVVYFVCSSAGYEQWSAPQLVVYTGGNVYGGGCYTPPPSVLGLAPPSFSNCMVMYRNGTVGSQLTIQIWTTASAGGGLIGLNGTFYVVRIT